MTRPPRPRRAARGTCRTPAAGDGRPKRSPLWDNGWTRFGGGVAPVSGPARATPARTLPTPCAVRGPWTPHGTLPTWRGTAPETTDKPCSPVWPTRRGRDQRSAARGKPRARRRRPWPRGARGCWRSGPRSKRAGPRPERRDRTRAGGGRWLAAGSTPACRLPTGDGGRWGRAHGACRKSGVGQPAPRSATSWASPRRARARRPSPWACRGSHGSRPLACHATCGRVTRGTGGRARVAPLWTPPGGSTRRRCQRTPTCRGASRTGACRSSGARGDGHARDCTCGVGRDRTRCAPWPVLPRPCGSRSWCAPRNAAGWPRTVPGSASGLSPQAPCPVPQGW